MVASSLRQSSIVSVFFCRREPFGDSFRLSLLGREKCFAAMIAWGSMLVRGSNAISSPLESTWSRWFFCARQSILRRNGSLHPMCFLLLSDGCFGSCSTDYRELSPHPRLVARSLRFYCSAFVFLIGRVVWYTWQRALCWNLKRQLHLVA